MAGWLVTENTDTHTHAESIQTPLAHLAGRAAVKESKRWQETGRKKLGSRNRKGKRSRKATRSQLVLALSTAVRTGLSSLNSETKQESTPH